MTDHREHTWLTERARSLLLADRGAEARFHEPALLKDGLRSRVIRCHWSAPGQPGGSVILKQMKEGGDPPTFFGEWASLAWLTERPAAMRIVPRFLAGDTEGRFFAMEDLGAGETLDDALRAPDGAAARRALLELARQTARLHAATLGDAAGFEAIRGALPGAERTGRWHEAEQWLAGRDRILAWWEATGTPLPAGFAASCEGIARLYAEPGPFLAFTHGDPAPTNNHLAGDRVRLLDFEYGGFRHALYDLSAWNVLCPLPEPIVAAMLVVYQRELAPECAAAAEEARFRGEWAALCAYRALAMLTWISPRVLVENEPWVGKWTRREAALTALARLCHAGRDIETLEPIVEAAAGLRCALQSRWPELGEPSPTWPAWQTVSGK
jgi:hypothetical protein